MFIPLALLLLGLVTRTAVCEPTLTANDFTCYITRFAAGESYANCDGVGGLTANDFACFIARYAERDPYANCDGSWGGWSEFPLPPGAVRWFVSSSTGSDSNPGTLLLPFSSLAVGYAAVVTGRADQLLLKCGDTWNEAAQLSLTKSGSATAYQVIGSYGTGPRPKIVFGNTSGIRADPSGFVRSLAIVGLELDHHPAYTGRVAPLTLIEVNTILIEDCYIHGGTDNIVIQTINPNASQGVPSVFRCTNIRIRRNVIADASNRTPGDMRGGGCYMQDADDWIIEENLSDNNGDPVVSAGDSNTGRNWYIHETCSPGIYRNNIGARGFDGDIQQRPGGTNHNNLYLANPINCYVGYTSGVNDVQWNVVIESGDINQVDRRGIGLHVSGPSIVKNNVVAYNTGDGWGSVKGLHLKDASGECSGNFVWDWTRDPANGGPGDPREGQGVHVEGGGPWVISNNRVYAARHGIIMEPGSSSITGTGNVYWSPLGGLGDFRPFITFPGWTKTVSLPANPNVYTCLPGGSIDAFITEARKQRRANFNPALTAPEVNRIIRNRVGVEGPN